AGAGGSISTTSMGGSEGSDGGACDRPRSARRTRWPRTTPDTAAALRILFLSSRQLSRTPRLSPAPLPRETTRERLGGLRSAVDRLGRFTGLALGGALGGDVEGDLAVLQHHLHMAA